MRHCSHIDPTSDFTEDMGAPEPKVDNEFNNISTWENQSRYASQTGRFTWRIEKLSYKLDESETLTSESFCMGGYKWKVLVYVEGIGESGLSLFLLSADAAELPLGWNRLAHFTFSLVNQIDPELTVKRDLLHHFNLKNQNYGFPSFLSLEEFLKGGFYIHDSIIVEVQVDVQKVSVMEWPVRKRPVEYTACDSRKETGYIGLINEGNTCYLNSLLQSLYHLPSFRKAVYSVPTTKNDFPAESLLLALQHLFYEMQYGDTTPETVDLIKSIGWDESQSSSQQDIHEVNRTLCENLEEMMEGTSADGTIQRLFEGHVINIIECIDVDYMSPSTQAFYDLQLDVKGCKDIYESLDKYVEVEKLEGKNRYMADQFGLQDATKGVKFVDFPPVLQLHLKRFDFSSYEGTTVKINDRFEFPLQLDLDREKGKYLSRDSDRSVPNLYTLHSVLVHAGDCDAGHYYAFIRPTLSDQWYKFDDDLVTKAEPRTVLEEHCGKDPGVPETTLQLNIIASNSANAYMLVYIRESEKEKVLCSIDQEDIAEHLQSGWWKEHKEPEGKRSKR